MADHLWRKNIPEDFDGRFGKRFDDELKISGILWTVVGVVVCCVLGFLITWGMNVYFLGDLAANTPPPSPLVEANERQLPDAPRLQAGPEAELEQMKHELKMHLEGFGWVDQASGVVHIPIARAIDLMLQTGPPASSDAENEVQGPVELEAAPALEEADG